LDWLLSHFDNGGPVGVPEHHGAVLVGVLVLNAMPAATRANSLASFALRSTRGNGRLPKIERIQEGVGRLMPA
jgi:hypothetical protein